MNTKEARAKWRKIEYDIHQMRWLALQILCHPDITAEQLADVHRGMVHTMSEYRRAKKEYEKKGFFTFAFQPDRRLL